MKKIIALTMISLAGLFSTAKAQASKKATPLKYEAVVSFNSICCGPPSDSSLKKFVQKYQKTQKVKLTAYRWGACGREGEYKILFSLKGFTKAKSTRFLSELKGFIGSENRKNEAAQKSIGNIELETNIVAADIKNCRSELVSWK